MSSEIRYRGGDTQGGKASAAEDTANSYIDAINDLAPTAAKKYVSVAAPYVITCVRGAEMALPYLFTAYNAAMKYAVLLEPYKLDLLLPGFVGLIMCFFGGRFVTIIAACEAYRMIGLQSQVKFVRDLKEDFSHFLEVNRHDDEVDDDGDGIADVAQIDKKALFQRKVLLFLKTVEPVRVSDALAGLQSGFLAVIATLKMQFCKAITLGSAIGEIMMKPANKYVLPVLENVLPEEYRKWGRPAISYTVKMLAISFAWTVQRIISAFHSAMRGGHMFAENFLGYLNIMGYYQIDTKNSQVDEMLGYGVTACGLWFQLRTGFNLPFPLNILLLPFTILEWWLTWILNIQA